MIRRARRWRARLGHLLFPGRRERDLAAELESHLELQVEENLRAGMSAEEARRAAVLRLGGVGQARELCQDLLGLPALDSLLQDVRQGFRQLTKTPSLSLVAIATLALSMGATSTLFSVVYDGLWRSDGTGLDSGAILAYYPARHLYSYRFSVPEFRELKGETRLFQRAGAIAGFAATFTAGPYPEVVQCTRATPDQFERQPVLGRLYGPDEDRPGGPAVAVITAEFWKRVYLSDPRVLGTTIRLDRTPYTIIGVLPERAGLWGGSVMVPFQLDLAGQDRTDRPFWVTVTLRDGVSREAVTAGLAALAERWERDFGKTVPEYSGLRLVYRNGAEWMRAGILPAVYVLAGAVGLVLLIAGVNLAALLLSRVAARRREIAVRLALGASRARIARQLLVESIVLALCGGACGVLASWWGVPLAVSFVPYDYLAWPERIRLEPEVVAACFGLCVVIGLLFGLAPAVQLSRVGIAPFVGSGGPRTGPDRGARSARRMLVVAETALGVVLISAAGLLVRSYDLLTRMDLGFQPRRLLIASLQLPEAGYPTGASRLAFYRELLRRLQGLPGVEGVSLSSARPMVDRAVDRVRQDFTVLGGAPADPLTTPSAHDYFRVMGMRVLLGRAFSDDDTAERPHVALVNQALARDYWPDGDPVGRKIRLGSQNPSAGDTSDADVGSTLTIVGVVADAKQVRVIDAPTLPEIYVPIAQRPAQLRGVTLLVRSSLPADSLAGSIRAAVAQLDPEQPVGQVATMDKVVADAFGPKRLTTAVLLLFASLVVGLVVVCYYATLAYGVAQRSHEIGVRAVLGAGPGQILRSVLGEGLALAAVGAGTGVAAALALTRFLKGMLYGVGPQDPVVLGAAVAILVVVALAAGLGPARRAMRLDPLASLRNG